MPKNRSFVVKFLKALLEIDSDFVWEFEEEFVFSQYGFSENDKQYLDLLRKNYSYNPNLYEPYI